jgi:hypothetical protein
MRALALAAVVVGCGAPPSARTFSWNAGVECHRGDGACHEVEAHIDELLSERGTFRRTVWNLVKMGGRAVPTLRRELHAESVMHVKVAVYVLTAMGRGDEVDAWCLTLDKEGRDLVCLPRAPRVTREDDPPAP